MIKQPRLVPLETPDNSSDSSDSENEEGKEIQVEFEARSPEGEDYLGIKRLLQQLFLKTQIVDCSRVTDTILAQRGIGSVIKQSVPDQAVEDEAQEDATNEVYAISTVLNLADKTKDSVIGLRRFLLEQTAKGNDRQVLKYVTDLLAGKVGFLINERFINIPAQITVPLLETLVLEMRKARDRNLPYDFENYIIICKLYKPKNLAGVNPGDQTCIFSNPEEELFVGESELCIDYDVSGEISDASSNWAGDGVEMTPWRRIVVFKADKLEALIRCVRDSFPHSAHT